MRIPLFNALIVDDEPIARKSVRFALESEGFNCIEADDGDQALQRLAETTCDLVVTDMCMPKMHGHSLVIELLKQNPRPIIIVHTSFDDPRLTRELMVRGVEDVIYKPSNYTAFAAKVSVLAARRRVALEGQTMNREPSNEHSPGVDGTFISQPKSTRSIDVFLSCVTPETALEDLITYIQTDSHLSDVILRAANSSELNRSGRAIVDIREAACRLGFRRIGDLALDQLKSAQT